MKNSKKVFLCVLGSLYGYLAIGQNQPALTIRANQTEHISPGGFMDNVFDQYGNKYALNDLKIESQKASAKGIQTQSTLLCTSGYFNLYFESQSGMEGAGSPDADRRNVICQVFSDISTFITSPLTTTGSKVNIWVRDINQIVPGASSSGVLGLASSFYNVPPNSTVGFGGIADNEIWKTIHSGADSYTNVASPLVTAGGTNSSGGTFYHGMVAFNFNSSSINWNTDLSLASAPSSLYDLYSVALHEVTHALGFASLINYDGSSKFGTAFKYYSRYDRFLKNNANTQYLLTNSGSCSLYNYQFNASLAASILTPGCSAIPPVNSGSADATACGTAIRYVGSTNVPVYTPSCFEAPSSFSHFEDECFPSSGSPYGNNTYFSMSNANGLGSAYTKRHLTPEERLVLCDLGYATNSTYGSTINNNYFNYSTSACAGINVAGTNDGISPGGAFVYTGNPSAGISISGILGNDYNASTFECLADVYDPAATLSATSGNNSTIVNFSSAVPGTHLLRYIPVSGSQRGNITYIYIYVLNGNCVPSACSLLNNGGFESSTTCGQLAYTNSGYTPTINCWEQFTNTADIFQRNCTNPSFPNFTLPTNFPSAPSTDSWNGNPNNTFIGLGGLSTISGNFAESVQSLLNSPIVQNGSYTISFRAKNAGTYFGTNSSGINGSLLLGGTASMLAPTSGPVTSLPSGVIPFVTFPIISDNNWHYYTQTFTYTGVGNLSNFIVLNSTTMNTATSQPSIYTYIDDVTLVPANQSIALSLPSIFCLNQTIPDLTSYLSPASYGGVFSGPGVSVSGGIYSFNATTAGVGNHTLTYTFTNNLGCTISISDDITVVNSSINLTASASPTNVCASAPVTLTGSGATTYTWQPGALIGNPIVVNPTANTTYVLNGTNAAGCQANAVVSVTAIPIHVTLSASANPLCSGQPVTLTPGGATTYTLQPGNLTGAGPFVLTPAATTIYSVTGSNASSCTGNAQITITVQACSTCSICPNILPATLSSNPTPGLVYCLNANMTISGNITIYESEVKILPGVTIIVPAACTLNVVGSHLYNCSGSMWRGIIVQPKGNINVIASTGANAKSSLIEDANIAIDVASGNGLTTNVVTSNNATFNRNNIGIRIQDYVQTSTITYPFTIINTVFTCRDIPFTQNSITWPQTSSVKANTNPISSPLETPYIHNGLYSQINANAYLKNPLTGQKSQSGIYLSNVQSTTNASTTPTYYEMVIGNTTVSDYNVFDNQVTGLEGKNSNVRILNSIFQNARTTGTNGISGGFGINVANSGTLNNRLLLMDAGNSTCGVKFFDCSTAIYSEKYFDNTVKNADFRSTQSISAQSANQAGKYGIFMTTNKFKSVNIASNQFYNIETAITFSANAANYTVASPVTNGQYSGQVDIIQNAIRPQIPGNSITTQYVSYAINLSNISINTAGTTFSMIPNTTVNVLQNEITRVFRGISVDTWMKKDVSIKTNSLSLMPDPTTNALQYGISYTNNLAQSQSSISVNTITGYSSSTNANAHGLYVSLSSGQKVRCNVISNTYKGMTFSGNCNSTKTSNNSLSNHTYGFVLDNTGIIGTQGSSTAPCDNQYNGTWPAGTYKTAVLNGSNALNSVMYVRTLPTSYNANPDGSAFTSGSPAVAYASTLNTILFVAGTPAFLDCATYPNKMANPDSGDEPSTLLEGFDALLFPNPNTGHVFIKTGAAELNRIEVLVTDLSGKALYHSTLSLTNGLADFKLDVSAGTYLVKMIHPETQETRLKKLVIQK